MRQIIAIIASIILTIGAREPVETYRPIEMYHAYEPIEMYPMDPEETPEEEITEEEAQEEEAQEAETPENAPDSPVEAEEEQQGTTEQEEQQEPVQATLATNTTLPVTFDGVSSYYQSLYWAYAAYEPQQVIDTLNAYNVIIRVAPDARYTGGSCGLCTFRHLSNGYDVGYTDIGINAKSDNSVAISVNHEIGHALDEIIGMQAGFAQTTATYNPYPTMTISNSPEFQAIYAAERPTAGYPSWNSQNTLEWFAETYRYVVEHNETMRQRAPQSYEWVRTTVNAYLGTNL